MAVITPPSITPVPTPVPQRNDRTTFSSRVDAFVTWLITAVTEFGNVATNVSLNATDAATSANTASTQAGNATTAAGTATTKASEAAASALLAENLTESYQGALSADPTLDRHGNALSAGDWYINSVSGFIRAYTGSVWVNGVSAVSGVSSVNGLTGNVINIATTNTAQNLTNKTLTEVVYVLSGSTPAFVATNGAVQTWTLSAASSPTDSLSAGQSIILVIAPGIYTITWPIGTIWTKVGGSGSAPSLFSAGKTSVVLWKINSQLYASHLGDM